MKNVLFLSSGHVGDQCVRLLLAQSMSGYTNIQVVPAFPHDFDPRHVQDDHVPECVKMSMSPVAMVLMFSYATDAIGDKEEVRLRGIIRRVRSLYGMIPVCILAGYVSEIDTFQGLNEDAVTIENVEDSGLIILHKLYEWVLDQCGVSA